MATTFKDILDRAASTLWKDYKLDALYKVNEEVFYRFLSEFLKNSVDMFEDCLSPLDYHPGTYVDPVTGDIKDTYVFNHELEGKEVYILALGVCLGWYSQDMLDATQFRNHIQTREFKSFSEANSLGKKNTVRICLSEDLTREVSKYQVSHLDKLPFFGGD